MAQMAGNGSLCAYKCRDVSAVFPWQHSDLLIDSSSDKSETRMCFVLINNKLIAFFLTFYVFGFCTNNNNGNL